MSEKKRLDILLVERGIAESREKAKSYIMAGDIFVNGQREDKAGTVYPQNVDILYKGCGLKYVSRGGLKLEKALEVFHIHLNGLFCMDIGASTGGFTDCMLQNGAEKVCSIDVGYGQLAWKLRQDPRVICMEKTNFRYLRPEDITGVPDFASCDVSFISLSKILPAASDILKENGEMVCLIKPQFEAGREKVGKKGVVRDSAVHEEVITDVFGYAEDCGFNVCGLSYSPIRGPEGNIEYLLLLKKEAGEEERLTGKDIIAETVREANEEFLYNNK